MPDGSHGPSSRGDHLRDVRRLRWLIRLAVYPAITLSGLIYYFGLGLSLLQTLVPLGVGYVIATATIEYAFTQMVRVRKLGVYQDILHIISSALDLRDQATGGHSRRVAMLSIIIARQIHVDGDRLIDLERAAILHDIGKVAIADAILSKPGPLTEEEWQEMRKHPLVGYQMVKDVPFLGEAAEIILRHHEHFDGTGYPGGFKGEEIPLGARIFAVVDAYDAITSNRPYRNAMSHQYALEEIRRNAGSQFDPQIVEAFLGVGMRGPIRDESIVGEHAVPLS
ncbi:MAG: HD-GYP domain-containing protein [Dehalococcoidia bacterium]|nr:HD-GYP domain-containing protein [Dehalococcoidia bacterium]